MCVGCVIASVCVCDLLLTVYIQVTLSLFPPHSLSVCLSRLLFLSQCLSSPFHQTQFLDQGHPEERERTLAHYRDNLSEEGYKCGCVKKTTEREMGGGGGGDCPMHHTPRLGWPSQTARGKGEAGKKVATRRGEGGSWGLEGGKKTGTKNLTRESPRPIQHSKTSQRNNITIETRAQRPVMHRPSPRLLLPPPPLPS